MRFAEIEKSDGGKVFINPRFVVAAWTGEKGETIIAVSNLPPNAGAMYETKAVLKKVIDHIDHCLKA